MKKYYFIKQPPITNKFTFLVDDINQKSNWGRTTDIDKFEYNKKLLDEDFNIELKVKLLLNQKGVSTVIPIGRFITVFEVSADEKKASMTFMDFYLPLNKEQLKIVLLEAFSDNIANSWLEIQDLMIKEFKDEDDNVRLLKPEI